MVDNATKNDLRRKLKLAQVRSRTQAGVYKSAAAGAAKQAPGVFGKVWGALGGGTAAQTGAAVKTQQAALKALPKGGPKANPKLEGELAANQAKLKELEEASRASGASTAAAAGRVQRTEQQLAGAEGRMGDLSARYQVPGVGGAREAVRLPQWYGAGGVANPLNWPVKLQHAAASRGQRTAQKSFDLAKGHHRGALQTQAAMDPGLAARTADIEKLRLAIAKQQAALKKVKGQAGMQVKARETAARQLSEAEAQHAAALASQGAARTTAGVGAATLGAASLFGGNRRGGGAVVVT